MTESSKTDEAGESRSHAMTQALVEEWRYLRREVLLREFIQNAVLMLGGVWFGLATGFAIRDIDVVGFVAGCTALSGFWGYNDNLQLKMRPRLIEIEDLIGIGWERWVTSSRIRLVGPIGSGHQVTTRGFFLGSQFAALGLAIVSSGIEVVQLILMAGFVLISVLLLYPPRLREP